MSTKLYVGNLSFNTSEQDVRDLFSQHGEVSEAVLIVDKITGRSRGFAFVTYESDAAANAAIERLDGQDLDGRNLTVNVAKPKEDRPSYGGGGGGGGGYRGGGGGGGGYRGGGGGRDRR